MYNDYLKVLTSIQSCTTEPHIIACENLCEFFKQKWYHRNDTYLLYYEKLILELLYKKQTYGK